MIAAPHRAARAALIVGGMILLAFASLRVGIGLAAAAADPRLSLAWAPGNAWALRRRAEDRLQIDRSAAGIAAATRDARAALARQLLEPAALRTLGLARALGGDAPAAATLLGLSQHMSRRDAKAQIWFASEALAAGDIGSALRHYDIALRTSEDSRALLYPILCRALGDRQLGGAVAAVIAPAPNWTTEFVNVCSDSPGARHALAIALTRAPAALAVSGAGAKAKLVAGLARDRDYATAFALFRAIDRGRAFGTDPALPPFDWAGTDAADFLAAPVERDGLYVLAEADRGGLLASRLLLLPAGRHRLTVDDPTIAGGLEWSVACDGGAPIATLDARGGGFALPSECPAVWLTLRARAGWPNRREGVLSRIAIGR